MKTKKDTPLTGSQSGKQGKSKTYSWANNNAKLVISQGITWLLLNVGYWPWLLITMLMLYWSQEVSI
jgi:hypothetical protein